MGFSSRCDDPIRHDAEQDGRPDGPGLAQDSVSGYRFRSDGRTDGTSVPIQPLALEPDRDAGIVDVDVTSLLYFILPGMVGASNGEPSGWHRALSPISTFLCRSDPGWVYGYGDFCGDGSGVVSGGRTPTLRYVDVVSTID